MLPTLALEIFIKRPEFGAHAENTAAMDLFVLANLGFLFFLLGFFAVCGWMIWRRTTKPEPHMQLLMEMEVEQTALSQKSQTFPSQKEESAPWERSADWWRQ